MILAFGHIGGLTECCYGRAMAAIEQRVNRTDWPAGPWDAEDDREEWTTAAGLPGLMVRSGMGNWCGYAAVNPGHPLHGRDWDEVDHACVHGGLTYAGACEGRICHTPEPGQEDNVWWFGFDCAHMGIGDLVPAMPRTLDPTAYGLDPLVYRDTAYVRAEVESLARQLVDAASEK